MPTFQQILGGPAAAVGPQAERCRVGIIGAGFAGLCAAIQLKRAGYGRVTLYERASELGGTWHYNRYPGAACDVPSFLYSFSFAQNSGWTRKFAPQSEILQYLQGCAREFGVHDQIRFGVEIKAAHHEAGLWVLSDADGERYEHEILVCACGQLDRPYVPPLPGLDDFKGTTLHSARWPKGQHFRGQRVAVVGSGASAVQIVPELAEQAEHLTVFQRSPNWMMPRLDHAYAPWLRKLYDGLPGARAFHRLRTYLELELRFTAFGEGSRAGRFMERVARASMEKVVEDETLRAKLTPDYPIGCKRILISDNYYQSLQRENVALETESIERITERGVVTADGRSHELDAIVFATGFDSTHFLSPIDIVGPQGSLQQAWKEGAEAYLGMLVEGFPNFFVLYGPNTNLGHNSIIFMIECQVHYLLQALHEMGRKEAATLEVTPEAARRYNDGIQQAAQASVWSGNCTNWYKTESGKIVNNWPHYTFQYWWRTRGPQLKDLRLSPSREAQRPAAEPLPAR